MSAVTDDLLALVRDHFIALACARCEGRGRLTSVDGSDRPGEVLVVNNRRCEFCGGSGAVLALRCASQTARNT